MTDDDQYEDSLGGETFAGGARQDGSPKSFGDEATLGGGGGGAPLDDDLYDDGMEVVDLSSRYTTEGTLGKGGMGEVLLATDTRLERKVAIKRILGSAARSKTAINRFLTEAKSIAAVKHNNIVDIYDFGLATDGPFLIMEYVEGNSLLEKCRRGPIELEEAVDLTCQLCDGLAKAHAANIIHRDIKPANVLLTEDGIPKLTDFGLAKDEAADTGMTMAGAVLGTLDFMPPEQRKDAALTDSRSDLWSLAATLYQMVTGEPPRVIDLDDVPQELRKCISQALKSKQEERFQTAIELRDALRASLKSPEPVVQAVALGAGECPECHTRNESRRKFCSECAATLRIRCLKCETEIAVWEKVCGECGGKQQELLESRLAELEQEKERAEELRSQYGYEAALVITKKISAIEDDRFSQHRQWSDEFADSTKLEWEREQESANQHYSEAKTHREVFDYDSAIHAVESIPEAMRSSNVKTYLQSLNADRSESASLINEIKSSIQKRDLEQLLPKVERGLELLGDRADLIKLQQQLIMRNARRIKQRDDAYARAEQLLDSGNAKSALAQIERFEGKLTVKQQEAKTILQNIVSAETELSAILQAAKSDGVIDPQEVVELLSKTMDYLELNPNHASILRLKADLQQRLIQIPEKILLGFYISERTLSDLPIDLLSKLPSSLLPNSMLSNLAPSVIVQLPLITNSIGMQLKWIPSGTFMMGSFNGVKDEKPVHQVTLSKPFLLGVHEVTQEQYERVMGSNPSSFKGPQNPVEQVSWEDATEFCQKLSVLQEELIAGRDYRLPTEAEWEYACRAGTTTKYSFADDSGSIGEYAWCESNSKGKTHPVGQKRSNPWGLYDMHGNAFEWCADWYDDYPSGNVTDPTGPQSGSNRVRRGGSWRGTAELCRSAYRDRYLPSYRYYISGFRVSCVPSGQ